MGRGFSTKGSRQATAGFPVTAPTSWRLSWRSAFPAVGVALAVLCGYGVGVGEGLAGLAAAGVIALWLIPRHWLPSLALLTSRGLGVWLHPAALGSVQLMDVFLIAFLARTLVARPQIVFRRTVGDGALAAFLLWAWVVTIFGTGQPLALARVTVYALVGIVLAQDQGSREPFIRTVIAYASIETAITLPSLFIALRSREFGALGVTIQDPHLFGFLNLAALAFVLTDPRRSTRHKLLFAVFLGIPALLTLRRAVFLAFAVVLVALLLKKRWHIVLAVTVLTVAGYLAFTSVSKELQLSTSSQGLRADANRQSAMLFESRPLTGWGWATVGDDATEPTADAASHYVSGYSLPTYLLATTGVVGFALFVSVIFRRWWELSSGSRGAFAWFTAMIAVSFTLQPLYAGSMLTYMLFAIMAIGSRDGE